ncbi:hypothetical protein [Sanguibacter suarezii]|uniref:hypothetical protein n=1 Tax=Sanguibacter suarezii TaxID=60921 RepID=UPI000AF9728B|nr:hypothetical protein [Sanguibacter suarezii]
MSRMDLTDHRYLAGQFVAGPRAVTDDHLTRTLTFADLHLTVHPTLRTTRAQHGETDLLMLGTAVHPEHPTWRDSDVLEWLALAATPAELEETMAALAGRYVLFVRIGSQAPLVYGDACGLRPVFYLRSGTDLWLASQPGLLERHAGALRDVLLAPLLDASPEGDVWPAGRTPLTGVQMMLPNHRLSTDDAVVTRFWPSAPLPTVDPEVAAQRMARLLRGIVLSLVRRGPVTILLTGGYDSRALLAAAWPVRRRLRYLTVVDVATPSHDASIPLRLAMRGRLKLRFRWSRPASSHALGRQRAVTGQVWRDPNQHRDVAFSAALGTTALIANASEVVRCAFYEGGNPPETISAELLSEYHGWAQDPFAIEAFEHWLAGVPQGTGIHPLDLYYWECRVGVWGALSAISMELQVDAFSPFNCRELLITGLGTPVTSRKHPWLLHRRIVEILAPQISTIPYNATTFTWLKTRLPAPVRQSVRRLRRRAAGSDLTYR